METQEGSELGQAEGEDRAPEPDEWTIDPSEYPEQGTRQEKGRFLLQYAVLAPSVHNAQPWSFHIENDVIHLSLARPRTATDRSIKRREQYFSLGCAVENLSVAANRFNQAHRISYVPELMDASVEVDLNPGWTFGTDSSPDRFKQLTNDLISEDGLEDRSLSRNLIKRIQELPCEDVVQLQIIEDTGVIGKMLNLRNQLMEKRKEKQEARRKTEEKKEAQEASSDSSGIFQQILTFLRSLFSSGEPEEPEETENDEDKEEASYETPNVLPPAVMLYSWTDGPVSWIKCGRVFQRILLMTGGERVLVQPMHDVMANSSARDAVEKMISSPDNTVPQFLFRLGYGQNEGNPSPRIPVEELLDG